MATVTCHTEGCGNAGVAIELARPVDDETGQPLDPWVIICGVCGQPITDVQG